MDSPLPPSTSDPTAVPPLQRKRIGWGWLAGLVLLAGVGLLLWRFNPSQHGFYPQCILYKMTGLQCPGCGGLRATHELLHGRINNAFRLNPLLFVLMPLLLYLAVREAARIFLGKELPPVLRKPAHVWALLVLLLAFGILRNLPFGPFAWLR